MFNPLNINAFLINNSNRILSLMLLLLHAFLIWGDKTNLLNRAFFLCHYGLFLMWQPIWRSTEKLPKSAIVLLFGVGLLIMLFMKYSEKTF